MGASKPPPASGEFLSGKDLRERIRRVTQGTDVRCAVAFWSEDGIKEAFGSKRAARNARVVCDISMGSTSAAALEALGAPGRSSLKHLRGLHSKVLISELGLVTGSANVSLAALGRSGAAARLTEAATFHEAGSPAWKAAVRWFKDLQKRAAAVGPDELEWARRIYRPPTAGSAGPPVPGSLLDAIRLTPERFAGAGFVFVSKASSDAEVEAARESAKGLGGTVEPSEIEAWPRDGIFTGWSAGRIRTWPTLFFEFWQPKKGLRLYARTVGIHDPGNGSILSSEAWRTAKQRFGTDLPARSAIERADAQLALKVLGKRNGVLFGDAHALAKRLSELVEEA